MTDLLNLVGESYGEWTVIKEAIPRRYGRRRYRYWTCQCSCGATHEVSQGSLRSGASTKCLKCYRAPKEFGIHHKFYVTATHILSRCTCKTSPWYKYYGGRGIKVYPLWLNKPIVLTEYLAEVWLGQYGHTNYLSYGTGVDQVSVERIDNDGNYEPGNIRFATKVEQTNNRRL